ncbi:class I SAM-dependent methyltransferase [Clostridium tagluense]|uniref:class I SAM-dependent methyltransferase n=1 Tax=Clostridium tagluense TaxID=360422 RepID=UPI001CF2C50D|nr:class I SAM-dependent methyltransferase [Clostridium tagluense]MCB2310031.1 class I SAM-dependent methyltransferase [Clostridium tagluense]MCB2314439.1 class I SAM-dependent methyltransferase [Clostridium tagluense]MCB2319285.1 class I SAM-dependent methyltransferase [Clostridium tagluense]MCB2324625.1 class I SAM-dependent methyltransferase [Clostridium tagluense]MCB2329476.1 class I SAM-dependent methyltransferase [Clostridium tagluense]
MNNDMQEKWEVLHSQSRFRPKYPSEQVVQFVFRNFKRDGNTKILDLGCGAGRHVYFMAMENIDTYGVDISREGITNTEKTLKHAGLKARLTVGSVDVISFEDNYFDGILCYGVLYYCKKNEIEKAIDEIYRVLKIGGKGLLLVRNKNDYRFGDGKEIEKNTFIIQEENSNNSAFNENGMTMHLFERDELIKLFRKFKNVSIDEIIETYENGKLCDSNFKVIFEK